MLDSLRKLKVSVSADSQQISDKSCVEWTGIGTSSQDTPHIHKQYGCILRSGHRNQHRLPRNAGIHLGEYRSGRNMPQILVLPQISLQEITAKPDSKIPIFSVMFPSERITSPFENYALWHSGNPKEM